MNELVISPAHAHTAHATFRKRTPQAPRGEGFFVTLNQRWLRDSFVDLDAVAAGVCYEDEPIGSGFDG